MAQTSIPAADRAARLDRFNAILESFGLDGALVTRREDVRYLSGFSGSDAALLLSRRRHCLITDSRYAEEAERSAPDFETLLWKGGFAAFIGALCRRRRFGAIGYSPSSLTVAFFEAVRGKTGRSAVWRDIDGALGDLRAVKSEAEIAAVRAALVCAETAFSAARGRWKAGMTERDVKNDLEWEMRRRGADDAAFETIVASGANASLPHAHAGDRKLAAGGVLLVDFGARVGFYNSDLTRTLWVGSAPKVWMRRYRAVLAAQRAAMAAIAAGVRCVVPDEAARSALAEAGVGDRFCHSLGHGVGLAIHEEPRLGRMARGKLAAGNIVTVEPGVYFPGSGGIRVEDMALVAKGGAETLSSLPRGEDSIVL